MTDTGTALLESPTAVGETFRVMWLDDEPDRIAPLAEPLTRAGLEVSIARPSDVSLDDIHGPIVILDLKNDDIAGDGIVLARRIHARDPAIGIVFVSSFFGTPKYAKLEHDISPLARTV